MKASVGVEVSLHSFLSAAPGQLLATASLSLVIAFDALNLVMLNTELAMLLGNGSVFSFVVRSKVVVSAGYRTVCLYHSYVTATYLTSERPRRHNNLTVFHPISEVRAFSSELHPNTICFRTPPLSFVLN